MKIGEDTKELIKNLATAPFRSGDAFKDLWKSTKAFLWDLYGVVAHLIAPAFIPFSPLIIKAFRKQDKMEQERQEAFEREMDEHYGSRHQRVEGVYEHR